MFVHFSCHFFFYLHGINQIEVRSWQKNNEQKNNDWKSECIWIPLKNHRIWFIRHKYSRVQKERNWWEKRINQKKSKSSYMYVSIKFEIKLPYKKMTYQVYLCVFIWYAGSDYKNLRNILLRNFLLRYFLLKDMSSSDIAFPKISSSEKSSSDISF